MALEWCQNFVSAQYLEKELINFDFAYAMILTTSSLWLLNDHFSQFITELWPLNDVRILFPLNILKMKEWILNKFSICIDIDNI